MYIFFKIHTILEAKKVYNLHETKILHVIYNIFHQIPYFITKRMSKFATLFNKLKEAP